LVKLHPSEEDESHAACPPTHQTPTTARNITSHTRRFSKEERQVTSKDDLMTIYGRFPQISLSKI
jgi:hypothetical protein